MASKPPDAFLSYTRFDDRRGDVNAFREHLQDAVRAVSGVPFEIFQDVEGIGIGEHWLGKLDEMLNEARFFIPIVTPSYFTSKPCREELEKFLHAEAERQRNDLILPIYYIECDLLEDDDLRAADALARTLHERQRQDWRELRFEPFEAGNVRRALERLAREIVKARRRVVPSKLQDQRRADDAIASLPTGEAARGLVGDAEVERHAVNLEARLQAEEAEATRKAPEKGAGRQAAGAEAISVADWDVYISYAAADQEWVRILAENLHQSGLDVFYDEWEIGAGDVLAHRLDQGILASRNGVIVISPQGLSRPWVREEWAAMLSQALARGRRLVPVLLEDAELPPFLASREWIDFRTADGPVYLQRVEELVRKLKERRGPPPRTGKLKLPPGPDCLAEGKIQVHLAPDIFLSYAREDERRARELALAFEQEGYAIFWDRRIPPGKTWHSYIGQALTTARCIVVAWSNSSINSDWVIEEAEEGKKRRVLVPVLLQEVTPPFGFRTIQAADLVDWKFGHSSAPFRYLLDSIRTNVVRAKGDHSEFDQRTEPEPPPPTVPAVLTDDAQLEPGTIFRDIYEIWCPELVVIPPGEFIMGSTEDERQWAVAQGANRQWVQVEKPQHRVKIEAPLAIGRCSVTFEEYDHFADASGREKPGDEGWGRGRRPVINVLWEDAKAYVGWLSKKTGQAYRLLSEAEWEYAARAGTTTRHWWGDDITSENASFNENVGKTSEVGAHYPQNPWGLYDTNGNVWEWCEDCWNESYEGAPDDGSAWIGGDCSFRVIRGGSWKSKRGILRAAYRNRHKATDRGSNIGFRVARTLWRRGSSQPAVSIAPGDGAVALKATASKDKDQTHRLRLGQELERIRDKIRQAATNIENALPAGFVKVETETLARSNMRDLFQWICCRAVYLPNDIYSEIQFQIQALLGSDEFEILDVSSTIGASKQKVTKDRQMIVAKLVIDEVDTGELEAKISAMLLEKA